MEEDNLGLVTEEARKKKEQEDKLRALRGDLDPYALAQYEEEFKNIPSQQGAIKKAYESGETRRDWAELADKIAQGLIRFGAAKQGLKQGVDLSNIDIKGYDWDKARERALSQYKTELEPSSDREKTLAALIASGSKKKEERVTDLEAAPHMVDATTKEQAYRWPGKPGYFNASYEPIKAVPYEREKDKKEPSPYIDIAKENQLSRAQQDFSSLTKKNRETEEAVGEAKTLLVDAATNPAAFAALSAKMPRVMGEVGNLTETEQKRYSAGGKSVQDRMAQIYSDITKGTITPDNQKYLQDVLGAMEEANKRNLAAKSQKFIMGRSRILKLQPQELEGYLGIGEEAALQVAPTETPARKVVPKGALP